MADGWENARRRDDGNDHVTIRLAAPGWVRDVVVDTSYFVGNAPGRVRLSAAEAGSVTGADPASWTEIVPPTRVQPDTRHRFLVEGGPPLTHVRLDVFPDGGLSRLNIHGELEPAALEQMRSRWRDSLPACHSRF
jgi:allantoicase